MASGGFFRGWNWRSTGRSIRAYLDVRSSGAGGGGRVRVDTLHRRELLFQPDPSANASIGTLMMVFPEKQPQLRIRGSGTIAIPETATETVFVQIPATATPTQNVLVEARNVFMDRPMFVTVTLTPDQGNPVQFEADLNQFLGTGENRCRFANIPCQFPLNQRVAVHVWKR